MSKQGCRLLTVLQGFFFRRKTLSFIWTKSFSPRIYSILCLRSNFLIVIRLIGKGCIILCRCIIFPFSSLFLFFLSFNSSVSRVGKINLHSSRKLTSNYILLWRNNLFRALLSSKKLWNFEFHQSTLGKVFCSAAYKLWIDISVVRLCWRAAHEPWTELVALGQHFKAGMRLFLHSTLTRKLIQEPGM